MRSAQNDEQIKALEAVATWVEVILKENPDYNFGNIRADLWHSALLERLLGGEEPLPEPPPRAYSYPWYGLVEEGWEEMPSGINPAWVDEGKLIIFSHQWSILQERGEEDYIVQWAEQEQLYRCWRKDWNTWRIEKLTDEQLVELGL